ncbi:MAG: glycerophosphodiester phosphodiesterase [Acidobacteria bacterium]|nr:glycerophosphodiester phosphodiesterase [Acidobacteriota bacterium]
MIQRFLIVSLILAPAIEGAQPFAVHGHRGAMALRPENTIPSFQEAIRGGADFIELDVAVTSDNIPVISHDPVINLELCHGPGGKRPIHELTLLEVKQYDCGSRTLKSFPRQTPAPGARIPTLDEVLDLAKTSGIRFNIEIKSSPDWPVNYTLPPGGLARLVVDAVRRHKLERRVVVQSFDFRVVKAVRAIAPALTVAALYGLRGERGFADIARETGAQIVTPAFRLVTAEKLQEAHAAGVQVIPWTVDNREDWDRLIAMGVDGIITNDPGALVAHLKSKGLR